MKRLIATLCAATLLLGGLTGCKKEKVEDTSSETFSNITFEKLERPEIKYEKIGDPSTKPENTYKSGDVKETGVRIDAEGADEDGNVALKIGKKMQLKATLFPAKPAITAVYWESSNEKIVKVDKDGNILGMAPGCATIACTTVLGFSDTIKVYVYEYEGNDELANELLKLLNDARVKGLDGSTATSAEESATEEAASEATESAEAEAPASPYAYNNNIPALQYAINQRVYEEACEGSMDSTRPNFYGFGDKRQNDTILADYNVQFRANTFLSGVWGEYDAAQVAEILLSNENSKNMILDERFSDIAVGCFKNGEVTYWLVVIIMPF